MPLPRRVAKFNRDATNRVAARFAGRVPPFALVEHTGRRSGRIYRTPIMVFAANGGTGFAIALTYGPQTDWVRNLGAAGGGVLILRGRRVPVRDPRLETGDTALVHFPLPVRTVLRLMTVRDALVVTTG